MTDQAAPPAAPFSLHNYVRQHPVDALVSAVLLAGIGYLAWQVFGWAVLNSVGGVRSVAECRELGTGACWAVVQERGRLVLFGLYPFEQQWRAVLACIVLLIGAALSCLPAMQRAVPLMITWIVSFAGFVILMGGGVFGLVPVPQANWGGLALTFYIFSAMLITGMPLAIAFALIRHSGPAWLAVPVTLFIDFIRSIPLTVILFFMALVVPMLMPSLIATDKLWRVIAGFSLFFACYQAETLRGALQGLSSGQTEAAKALGLSWTQTQLKVVLPQVFRTALPQTVNQIVTAFKDTSYVAIVGFFDMTASASAALGSGEWATAYVEIYLLVAAIYLVFGYSLSRYGSYLEAKSDLAYAR